MTTTTTTVNVACSWQQSLTSVLGSSHTILIRCGNDSREFIVVVVVVVRLWIALRLG
jgi:hypothetical protein